MAGMSDSDGDGDGGAVFTPAPDRTKSGRMTFRNELNKRYGSKYRDADNTEPLMGELMPLGRAFGIMADACRSVGDLEECSQVLLERGHHQDRPAVARCECADPLHVRADEHCPRVYQDGSAQQCPLLWPIPCILRGIERRGYTVAPGPGHD